MEAGADAQRVHHGPQLADEEVDGQEPGVRVGQVGAAPAAQLVVVHDGPAVLRQVRDPQRVVVGRARSAVQHHQGRALGVGVEPAGHPVPGPVALELDVAGGHRRLS